MAGVRADHHNIEEWLELVQKGFVQLPDFQRDVVWSYQKVVGFLNAALQGRPVGCLLVLKTKPHEPPPFDPRPIEGSSIPQDAGCEYLILDGQQRITALWRALMNTDPERQYFIKYKPGEEGDGEVTAHRRTDKQSWFDDPKKCLERGSVPISLLRHPSDKNKEATDWIDKAYAEPNGDVKISAVRALEHWIVARSEALRTFEIPFLPMPEKTSENEAIETFIESNTSSQHLRKFDIVVGKMRREYQSKLREARQKAYEKVADLGSYLDESDVGDLLLKIACLRTGQTPVESQYEKLGVMADIKDNIDTIIAGLKWTITLLDADGIWDRPRLPSVVPLRVLPALHSVLPTASVQRVAAEKIARAYLWRAFLTERYGSTAATLLREDYDGLRKIFQDSKKKLSSVPIWNVDEYPLPTTPNDLLKLGWPTRGETGSRALLAITLRHGARDIGSNRKVSKNNIAKREYHHVFPKAYLEDYLEKEELRANRDSALNCILIEAKTNRKAADKPPMEYLKALLGQASGMRITKKDIERRLESHLVPAAHLRIPVVRPVSLQYQRYREKRAALILPHIRALADGEDP